MEEEVAKIFQVENVGGELNSYSTVTYDFLDFVEDTLELSARPRLLKFKWIIMQIRTFPRPLHFHMSNPKFLISG